MPSIPLGDIASAVQGVIRGNAELLITGVEHIDLARPGQLTLIGDPPHAKRWPDSAASAALVSDKLTVEPGPGRALVAVADADLALAAVLDLLAPTPEPIAPGRHPSAVVHPDALVADDARIGPGAIVGPRTRVAARCVIQPHAVIEHDCSIGEDSVIGAGTFIGARTVIGRHVFLHPHVTIGADGFGFRPAPDGKGLLKITHIGRVEIGDHVEIGAGTCVDRGKFSATVVGHGTKIDKLCQIAHNCRIGRSCVFAAQVGLAGTVTVGDGVMLGGKVGVKDHLTIGSGARIAAQAAVMHDVPPGATWAGYPAQELRETFKQIAAVKKLPAMLKAAARLLPELGAQRD